MPNKIERFTNRARRVLSLAQEEAEHLRHHQIGTEHLLLGLMREEGGVAGRVLRDLGLDLRRVEELVKRLSTADERTTNSQLDLSPVTKKVLELAVDEARRIGHHYIGTEHLLLGLLRQQEGIALDILRELGVDREVIRRVIIAVWREQQASDVDVPQPSTDRQTQSNIDYVLLRLSSPSGRISHFPIDLSPGLKDALEAALEELNVSEGVILNERHILLGLLHESESDVSLALLDMGIDLDELIRKLSQPSDT